jgi:hypothetical protein
VSEPALKLEARGQIRLPPRRTASVNGLRHRQAPPLDPEPSCIDGPFESVQPVRVQPVAEGTAEALLFKALRTDARGRLAA